MSIRVAFIVSAPLELTLIAGREELVPGPGPPPDPQTPFLTVGHHRGGEVHFSGPLIGDPDLVETSLNIDWYFPDEESPDLARRVNVAEAQVLVTTTNRPQAEEGWQWRYCLESRRPYLATLFFEGGFQPPFKAANITLHLDYLINYNYDGYIVSGLTWAGLTATEVEEEWRFPLVESEGILQD